MKNNFNITLVVGGALCLILMVTFVIGTGVGILWTLESTEAGAVASVGSVDSNAPKVSDRLASLGRVTELAAWVGEGRAARLYRMRVSVHSTKWKIRALRPLLKETKFTESVDASRACYVMAKVKQVQRDVDFTIRYNTLLEKEVFELSFL